MISVVGDFHLAEEIVQDAVLVALERWPVEGVPHNPSGWLFTVARHRAIDQFRRDARYREKMALLDQPQEQQPDDRLQLIFTCCHPALSREAQVALTLRTVCGLTTHEIAGAFFVSEPTIAQRLVRARRKIAHARIPYKVPDAEELNNRLNEVLAVLYLLFNEGYLSSTGELPERHDLTIDAEWLAGLLVRLMPGEPEPMGLLALIQLHRARRQARFDRRGRLVLLRDQDRSLWDRETIASAAELVLRASASYQKRPGSYQIQAAIVACHAEAPSWEETDWLQILLLYDALLRIDPSPVARLNRAIALQFVQGPASALREIDALPEILDRYHIYHASRAELLRELGRLPEARLADEQALQLTANPAERALLEQRLA